MTPEVATSWVIVVAFVICLIVGIAIVVVSIRTGWIAKKIALLTLAYAFLGLIFLTTPKWKEFSIEAAGFNATIARLESQKSTLISQNDEYKNQINQLVALGNTQFRSAGEAISGIENVRSKVEWATFLPASNSNFRVEVTAGSALQASELAQRLGTTPDGLVDAVASAGYTLLKNPNQTELQQIPADRLWISPSASKNLQ